MEWPWVAMLGAWGSSMEQAIQECVAHSISGGGVVADEGVGGMKPYPSRTPQNCPGKKAESRGESLELATLALKPLQLLYAPSPRKGSQSFQRVNLNPI